MCDIRLPNVLTLCLLTLCLNLPDFIQAGLKFSSETAKFQANLFFSRFGPLSGCHKRVKTFIPATEPPDPRRVYEGFMKGSLKGSLKGFNAFKKVSKSMMR